MRIPRSIPLLVLMAACHHAPAKPVDFTQVFSNLPLPPNPQLLVRQTGVDAMQFTVLSNWSADSVDAYYRQVLSTEPFRLINERADGKMTSFYAEQAGPSLWVTVRPNPGGGSEVTIAGAKSIDSTKVAGH